MFQPRVDAAHAVADAFIEWINSFDHISHPCKSIGDLYDGIVLFEVLADIDPKWFKLIRSADVGDNWVLRVNNLKKLHRLVSLFYKEKLNRDPSTLPSVNLNLIAKEADVDETISLCQLVLGIAIQCDMPQRQTYIEKIQSLSQPCMQVLMQKIEELLSAAAADNAGPSMSEDAAMMSTGHPGMYDEEVPTIRNPAELARVMQEKKELEAQHRQLIEEHGQLRYKYDELEDQKEELKLRLREMDKAVEQAQETGKADFIMRTEIEHLKQDLQRSEDRRQEIEMALEMQTGNIEELTRKKEQLAKKAEQASRLSDKLDELRHVEEKLQKAENVIEKYKKKLEESADMRRQIKAMEEQNNQLIDRNMHIEEEYRKILAFKTLMDSYKEQIASLETQNNELMREKNKIEYELRHMTKKIELLEADKVRDSDRIQVLEENLQEVQFGGSVEAAITQRKSSGQMDDDMEIDDEPLNGDTLEESLKESNVTELKMSKRRLERQLKTLREENASGNPQRAVVLQHLLDDANRMKAQYEKSYLEASQERDILQSDMARIREGIPDALLAENEHLMPLRVRILDLEKESKKFQDEVKKLEGEMAKGKFAFGDNDLSEFHQKYKEMEERSQRLEEQNKSHLQDINKLLLEKDMLQSQTIEQKDMLLEKERLYSDMKSSLAAFEAKDDEPVKQQNVQLQQQVIHLQEQNREYFNKMKKAKEFIKQQDKMLKETKLGENTGNYDEAVASLKSELLMKDEENEKLKKQIHEIRLQARREQQVIISAWYDVARKTHKELSHSKVAYPNSWLGQQRRTLDNQLKRR